MLEEYGIPGSMSRRGNGWDNACSQTLFGSLKVERLPGNTSTPDAKPKMKLSSGCSDTTALGCTRR